MQQFDLKIEYCPGEENTGPDSLSRIIEFNDPVKKAESQAGDDMAISAVFDEQTDWLFHMPCFLDDGSVPGEVSEEVKDKLIKEKENFKWDGELLWRRFDDSLIPYIPLKNRADLFEKIHKSLGHIGREASLKAILKKAWWPTVKSDVEEWLLACKECQMMKTDNLKHEPLNPLPPVNAFERWGIDLIGRLPTTNDGNRWIITAIDYAIKYPVARAVKEGTTSEIGKFIYEEILCRFGCPQEIVTDRRANFSANVSESYLLECKIRHSLTSAYHPRSNGMVEKFNGFLGSMITKFCRGHINKWDQYVDQALLACRSRIHAATGKSPAYLAFGKDIVFPGDRVKPFVFDSKDEKDVLVQRLQILEELKQERLASI